MLDACNRVTHHHTELFDQWTESSAYLLGYLEADGCIVKDRRITNSPAIAIQFSCSENDAGYLQNLKNLCQYTGKTSVKTHHIGDKAYRTHSFVVRSRFWKPFLDQHLRQGRIPEELPEDLRHHYIRGYLDGDGSVYWQGSSLMVSFVFLGSTQGSQLAQQILEVVKQHVGWSRGMQLHRKTNCHKCWYFRIAKQDLVARLGSWLYEDATIYLKRKKDRFDHILKGG